MLTPIGPMRLLAASRYAAAAIVGLSATMPVLFAQPRELTRIADVRRDANGDGQPDALGRIVTVGGRATLGTGVFNTRNTLFYLQDATGGMSVFDTRRLPSVVVGDSVIVTGRVSSFRGAVQLDRVTYRIVGGERRAPAPLRLGDRGPAAADVGRLVSVTGRVVEIAANRSDLMALRSAGDEPFVIGVISRYGSGVDVRRFRPGDRLTITGLLDVSQEQAGGARRVELSPRSSADVRVLGLAGLVRREFMLALFALALLAVAWAVVLRREVTRQTRRVREISEYHKALIENAADIVTVVDAQGVTKYVSPAIERVLGYQPDEMIGRASFDYVHPDDIDATRDAFAGLVAAPGEQIEIELRARHRDGSSRLLSATLQNLLHHPTIRAIVCNARDVTAEREHERALRDAQKMEAVGRLAGGIAHDFNNLLTAVLSYADFVLAELPSDSALRDDVSEIRNAASRAASLTRQLLAFSKSGATPTDTVSLNDAVSEMQLMLSRLVSEEIRVVTVLDPTVPAVRAARGQLDQVVMNLVLNARDAMPHGGMLTVETCTREIGAEVHDHAGNRVAPGRYAVLVVRDTGTGMDGATASRMFEPFFSTKASGGGTGLGLATVYGIVGQARGFIQVKTAPQQGTIFEIHFPAADSAPSPLEPRARRAAAAGLRLLLVEDEPAVRAASKRILAGAGHHVTEAVDGRDALERFRQNPAAFDAVVTDVVMPRMGGRELAEQCLRIRPHLPMVFVSGYFEEGSDGDLLAAPGSIVVPKPFDADALLEAVGDAVATVGRS